MSTEPQSTEKADPEPEEQRTPTTDAGDATPSFLFPLALSVLSLAAMVGGSELRYWLRYEREAILGGEVWRVLGAHIAHLGWPHLLVNLGGLLLIWLVFGRAMSPERWAVVFCGCAFGVTAGLLLFHPELGWYVGMSGVLHGMFVAGAVSSLYAGYRLEWLLLGLLALKLVWEQIYGPMTSTEEFIRGTVIVDAHLYGAVAGLAVILVMQLFRRRAAA